MVGLLPSTFFSVPRFLRDRGAKVGAICFFDLTLSLSYEERGLFSMT